MSLLKIQLSLPQLNTFSFQYNREGRAMLLKIGICKYIKLLYIQKELTIVEKVMREIDSNNSTEKPKRSKVKVALTVLSAVSFLIAAIFMWRIWLQFDVESFYADYLWRNVMRAVFYAIVGCGCYMLRAMGQAPKGRKYLIIGIYVLILALAAVFYFYLVDLVDIWFQY